MIKKKLLENHERKDYVNWLDTNPEIPTGMNTIEAYHLQTRKTGQLKLEDYES